ncbi:Gp49 family protein [Klebsiella pneumoniae]|nr:Gp49 family protein [Klebsiella pneumoniae]
MEHGYPLYLCHKNVQAFRIERIVDNILVPAGGLPDMPVTWAWMQRHLPKVGGYYVVYEDGYASYSPADVFESGYSLIKSVEALEEDVIAASETATSAPRIKPSGIDEVITRVDYINGKEAVMAQPLRSWENENELAPLSLLTLCVITLKNGYTVTGMSACASPENFDAAIGREIAYNKAREQIWPLEGYLLRQRLFEGQ